MQPVGGCAVPSASARAVNAMSVPAWLAADSSPAPLSSAGGCDLYSLSLLLCLDCPPAAAAGAPDFVWLVQGALLPACELQLSCSPELVVCPRAPCSAIGSDSTAIDYGSSPPSQALSSDFLQQGSFLLSDFYNPQVGLAVACWLCEAGEIISAIAASAIASFKRARGLQNRFCQICAHSFQGVELCS